jgi:hypothetical protein
MYDSQLLGDLEERINSLGEGSRSMAAQVRFLSCDSYDTEIDFDRRSALQPNRRPSLGLDSELSTNFRFSKYVVQAPANNGPSRNMFQSFRY